MEGWILLGKIKKVSSIMVDVWSIRIRRGHFLLLFWALFVGACKRGEVALGSQCC